MDKNIEKLFKRIEQADVAPQKSVGAYSGKKIRINEICTSLNEDTASFDPHKTLNLLQKYSKEEERLLYSEISNYIFSLESSSLGKFITNLDSMIECSQQETNLDEKTKKLIFKLYDHSQLAIAQSRNLVKDDTDFQMMIERRIAPIYGNLNAAVENAKKDINSQLISLLGIFTALAFLIFGGINSLDNIFQGMQSLPVLKLMITGCIWGICILNIIFVFMYFVAKITKTNIKTNLNFNANFIQRYPYICWSNLIIATILAICAWCYYIDDQNIGSWFVGLSNTYQMIICIMGFGIIGFLFLGIAIYIINKCK